MITSLFRRFWPVTVQVVDGFEFKNECDLLFAKSGIEPLPRQPSHECMPSYIASP